MSQPPLVSDKCTDSGNFQRDELHSHALLIGPLACCAVWATRVSEDKSHARAEPLSMTAQKRPQCWRKPTLFGQIYFIDRFPRWVANKLAVSWKHGGTTKIHLLTDRCLFKTLACLWCDTLKRYKVRTGCNVFQNENKWENLGSAHSSWHHSLPCSQLEPAPRQRCDSPSQSSSPPVGHITITSIF